MTNILSSIKSRKPLIHHITNVVTVSDCAQITRSWGALPIMAYAIEEVAEMVSTASALVLNIGTLQKEQVEAMIKAAVKANQIGIPVILDPVGVGATYFRTESVREILHKAKIAVIKGNPGEISILAGEKGIIKGVESVGDYSQIGKTSLQLGKMYQCVVIASGAKDTVSDGSQLYQVSNGHPLLANIVGTGCMLTSTVAVFCSVATNYLDASLDAVAAFGLAAELAADKTKQPQSFKQEFMNIVSAMDDNQLNKGKKIKKVLA
jgi:hydroxyethylthiazole kinase